MITFYIKKFIGVLVNLKKCLLFIIEVLFISEKLILFYMFG